MIVRPPFLEDGRQLVHMAAGPMALPLRVIAWWETAAIAGATVAFSGGRGDFLNAVMATGAAILFGRGPD